MYRALIKSSPVGPNAAMTSKTEAVMLGAGGALSLSLASPYRHQHGMEGLGTSGDESSVVSSLAQESVAESQGT